MIDVVVGLVVGFLKTNHSVKSVGDECFIVGGVEGLHFYFYVGEIFFCDVYALGDIGNTCLYRVFACDNQNVFEWGELFDGFKFVFNLLGGEYHSWHLVLAVEGAVDAGVGAGVGDIERDEDLHRVAKPLTGIAIAQLRHRLQIGLSSRRDQGHEVLHIEVVLRQCAAYIRIALGVDGLRRGIPINLF